MAKCIEIPHPNIKRLIDGEIKAYVMDSMYDYNNGKPVMKKDFFDNIIKQLHENMDDK